MSGDIETYNAAGQLLFRASDYLGRVLGAFDTGTSDGSYTFPGAVYGTMFASVTVAYGIDAAGPQVTVSGSTISWSFITGLSKVGGRIIFGCY